MLCSCRVCTRWWGVGWFWFFFFWSGGKPILFNLYCGSLKHQMAYSVFPVLCSFFERIRKTGLLSCGVVSRTLKIPEGCFQNNCSVWSDFCGLITWYLQNCTGYGRIFPAIGGNEKTWNSFYIYIYTRTYFFKRKEVSQLKRELYNVKEHGIIG